MECEGRRLPSTCTDLNQKAVVLEILVKQGCLLFYHLLLQIKMFWYLVIQVVLMIILKHLYFIVWLFIDKIIKKGINMKRILPTITILLIGSSLFADTYFRDRTITGAGVYYTALGKSVLFITLDGDNSTMKDCGKTTNRFAINSSLPHFKEIVSLVLNAYVSKENKVDILAGEDCTYFPNAQDFTAIKVGNMMF